MKKKVAVIASSGIIAPYVMEGYAKAFSYIGCEVFYYNRLEDTALDIVANIRDFSPDFVVAYRNIAMINELANNSGGIVYPFEKMGIPVVCLFYDNPFFSLMNDNKEHIKKYPDLYKIYVWDTYYINLLKLVGINSNHLMLALDDEKFYKTTSSDYLYDVSFVGKFSKTIQNQYQDGILINFFNDILNEKISNPGKLFDDILKTRYPEINSLEDKLSLINALHHESQYFRWNILKNINYNQIHVFGMENKTEENLILHEKVDYTTELPDIYRKSKINLNISSLQLENSINNRVFDTAGVGGFILTEDKPDFYLLDKDIAGDISYKTINELNDKIRYFLNNDKERKEISNKLLETVIKNHTYKNRAQFILDTIHLDISKKSQKTQKKVISDNKSKKVEHEEKEYTFSVPAVVELLPDGLKTALDVGCSGGGLGHYLKNYRGLKEVVGIEYSKPAGEKARQFLDDVYIGDACEIELPQKYHNYFDVIIYADVLEHVYDPWKVIHEHKKYLKYAGYMLVSIPNLKNLYTILNLILDRFDYTKIGLLDNTHIRFFTASTAVEMFHKEGFQTVNNVRSIRDGKWHQDLNAEHNVNPALINIYDEIYNDYIKGLDCTQKFKSIFPLFSFTQDAVADFLTVQYYFLFINL